MLWLSDVLRFKIDLFPIHRLITNIGISVSITAMSAGMNANNVLSWSSLFPSNYRYQNILRFLNNKREYLRLQDCCPSFVLFLKTMWNLFLSVLRSIAKYGCEFVRSFESGRGRQISLSGISPRCDKTHFPVRKSVLCMSFIEINTASFPCKFPDH
jgi:hypothetical protein